MESIGAARLNSYSMQLLQFLGYRWTAGNHVLLRHPVKTSEGRVPDVRRITQSVGHPVLRNPSP